MQPETVVIASASLTAGYLVGGIALRFALYALRRLVRRTPTKVDDRILDALEDYLTEHPEKVGEVMDLLKRTPVR
jgi:hypothetical protein